VVEVTVKGAVPVAIVEINLVAVAVPVMVRLPRVSTADELGRVRDPVRLALSIVGPLDSTRFVVPVEVVTPVPPLATGRATPE